jgi:hypothetical protein
MDTDKLSEEKDNLRKAPPITLIDYIKTSIDILIDLKVEERLEGIRKSTEGDDKQGDYETLLRKLEGDIRQHIRVILINLYKLD